MLAVQSGDDAFELRLCEHTHIHTQGHIYTEGPQGSRGSVYSTTQDSQELFTPFTADLNTVLHLFQLIPFIKELTGFVWKDVTDYTDYLKSGKSLSAAVYSTTCIHLTVLTVSISDFRT